MSPPHPCPRPFSFYYGPSRLLRVRTKCPGRHRPAACFPAPIAGGPVSRPGLRTDSILGPPFSVVSLCFSSVRSPRFRVPRPVFSWFPPSFWCKTPCSSFLRKNELAINVWPSGLSESLHSAPNLNGQFVRGQNSALKSLPSECGRQPCRFPRFQGRCWKSAAAWRPHPLCRILFYSSVAVPYSGPSGT